MRDHDEQYEQLSANSIQIEQNQDTQIVRIDSPGARRWRVGLNRLDRQDQHAPLIPFAAPGVPESSIESSSYGYAAGFNHNGQWFPLRSNPVALSFDVDVLVNFGFGAAAPAHIGGQWPRMGGSLVLVGNYVEVFARWRANGAPSPTARPVATAWIAPVDGQIVTDSGELSLTQQALISGINGGGTTRFGNVYVPDFARRVRVSLTLLDPIDGSQQVVPIAGDPAATLAWTDDGGNVVDSWQQGLSGGILNAVQWHPVPSRATMLTIMTPVASGSQFAYVHWRIAP
jgi:hypothetical protein